MISYPVIVIDIRCILRSHLSTVQTDRECFIRSRVMMHADSVAGKEEAAVGSADREGSGEVVRMLRSVDRGACDRRAGPSDRGRMRVAVSPAVVGVIRGDAGA